MSVVCPQGHSSQSEDYCDICGAPIDAGGAAVATPAADPGEPGGAAEQTGPTTCPHCGSPAAPGALFCENCGYDFTTGTAPQPVAPNPLDLGPATPVAPPAAAPPAAGPPDAAPPAGQTPSDPPSAAPGVDPAADPHPEPDPEGEEPTNAGGMPTPQAPGPDTWVAEVWVDPDWYEAQKPEDPMPSPGSPQVIPLRDASVLVGRPSQSRGIRPQVDAGADTGVSRRHCQLSTDGLRWWVEDLGSANGTYVSPAGEPLPTEPLETGTRHELADDERVFIGAWTRLVVRKGLPGEV